MLYNKNKYNKSNEKKMMKKVKKQWIVVSVALLGLLGSNFYYGNYVAEAKTEHSIAKHKHYKYHKNKKATEVKVISPKGIRLHSSKSFHDKGKFVPFGSKLKVAVTVTYKNITRFKTPNGKYFTTNKNYVKITETVIVETGKTHKHSGKHNTGNTTSSTTGSTTSSTTLSTSESTTGANSGVTFYNVFGSTTSGTDDNYLNDFPIYYLPSTNTGSTGGSTTGSTTESTSGSTTGATIESTSSSTTESTSGNTTGATTESTSGSTIESTSGSTTDTSNNSSTDVYTKTAVAEGLSKLNSFRSSLSLSSISDNDNTLNKIVQDRAEQEVQSYAESGTISHVDSNNQGYAALLAVQNGMYSSYDVASVHLNENISVNEIIGGTSTANAIADYLTQVFINEGPGEGEAHGHYMNMVVPSYENVGIGVASKNVGNTTYYALVQVFSKS